MRRARVQGTGRLPFFAVIEQVLGDVGEDHVTGRREPFQRAERNQAVPGAHVEHGVTGLQPALVEHRVPDRVQQLGQETLTGGGIAAEPPVHQPPVPAVGSLRLPAVGSLRHTSHCARAARSRVYCPAVAARTASDHVTCADLASRCCELRLAEENPAGSA
jgi:hypothetical protein